MASTGTALFLSLQARTDALEAGLAKAKGEVQNFSAATTKHGEGMSSALAKVGLSGREAGESFKNLAAGLLLSAGQVDGVGEKAKALTQTLGAFISGGPIAGGIVGLTSLFKILAESEDKVSASAKKAGEDSAKFLKDISSAVDASAKSVESLGLKLQQMRLAALGIVTTVEDLALTEERASLQRQRDARVSTAAGVRAAGGDVSEESRAAVTSMLREAAALDTRIAAITRELEMRKQIRDEEEKAAKTKEEQEKSAKAIEEAEAERVRLMNEAVKAAEKLHEAEDKYLQDLKNGADEKSRLASLQALRESERVGGTFAELTGTEIIPPKPIVEKAERVGRVAGEHFAREMGKTASQELPSQIDPLFQQIGYTIEASLTDAIVDGITNGGERGGDIFRNLVDQLLRQLISSILQSGIQQLLGGIFGGGGGGGIGAIFSAFTGGGGGDGGYSGYAETVVPSVPMLDGAGDCPG